MFSADYSGGPLGEFFATEHPTWEEYGRSGEAFFGGEITGSGATPSGIETPFLTGSFWDFMGSDWAPGSQRHLVDPTGPFLGLLPVTVGPGRSQEGDLVDEAAAAAAAAADYVSDIPGEIGEAGGEFVAGLGAGVGTAAESIIEGVAEPITAIPGDLFEGIPTWVPLLGAAYLLTRQ